MEFGLEPQHLSALGDTEEFEKPDFSDFEPTAAFPAVVDAPVAPAPRRSTADRVKIGVLAAIALALAPLNPSAAIAVCLLGALAAFAVWATKHPRGAVLIIGVVVSVLTLGHHVSKKMSASQTPDYGGNLDLTK